MISVVKVSLWFDINTEKFSTLFVCDVLSNCYLLYRLTVCVCVCVCVCVQNTHYLYVPGPLVGLVSHLLLYTGQFLLQITGFMLVELRQVIKLVLQPLIPDKREHTHTRTHM